MSKIKSIEKGQSAAIEMIKREGLEIEKYVKMGQNQREESLKIMEGYESIICDLVQKMQMFEEGNLSWK